ncbi:G-protein coupled receptor Mth2 [Acyrthosiphon pisum]|uniref:G-protein coupled receptors family 2 profile 2 domain-containing protein n=1 Tax=Acyrthosiphon pisum TaxID=7029 RepID=A0A8R1WA24_ACYPI|nr:G-protein coupled receptor Mth2 [Acyrthosiphon pisum]|eukprot:XP_003242341.1 PREDICTED: G-protein coupled receptor Mth2 [Acyrthosiphon pisum]
MNTIRSCFAITVAFLVIAIGWWAADAVVCCNSSSGARGGRVVVASCRNKNRTFHTVEAVGGGTCDDNWTAVPVRKCCPLGQSYNPKVRFCGPAGSGGDKHLWRMMQRLRDGSREMADALMVGYDYEQPLCDAGYVLVDLPAEEVLMESYPSVSGFPEERCFDLTPSDELVARTCRPRDQICGQDNYTCVHRCCRGDRMIGPNGPECNQNEEPFTMSAYETDEDGRPIGSSNSTVLPYYLELKCSRRYKVYNRFQLTVDGSLYLNDEDQLVPDTEYCVEYQVSIFGRKIVTSMCAVDTVFEIRQTSYESIPLFYRASYVASAVCLVLTLILYNTLPSLRNIRNYYVKCYMHHQFLACICVFYQMSIEREKKEEKCMLIGYITLFVFLSTLCWLNVICFDIYWKIRYNISRNRNTSTSVRSIMYHFYSWGLPSTIVYTGYHLLVFTHYVSQQELAPYFQIPGDGCFYYHMIGYGRLIFFLIPMCIMLTANLIFFLLTAIQCSRIKSEINNFNPTDSKTESFLANKEIFVMSIKLFLIMEFPYLPSILSFSLEREETNWYIMHVASSLQGVLIFIVFVAKRKVIMDLRKKFRDLMDYSEPTQMNNISGSS